MMSPSPILPSFIVQSDFIDSKFRRFQQRLPPNAAPGRQYVSHQRFRNPPSQRTPSPNQPRIGSHPGKNHNFLRNSYQNRNGRGYSGGYSDRPFAYGKRGDPGRQPENDKRTRGFDPINWRSETMPNLRSKNY